jgi:hypothetical protein
MLGDLLMKKILLVLLLLPVITSAQVVIPTDYEFRITGVSSSTYTFPHANVVCNVQALPGAETTLNPRYIVWNDESNPGRYCVNDTGQNTGPLFGLPIGDFQASLVAVVATPTARLESQPSNTVSFSRLAQPAARTGLRVRGAQ